MTKDEARAMLKAAVKGITDAGVVVTPSGTYTREERNVKIESAEAVILAMIPNRTSKKPLEWVK